MGCTLLRAIDHDADGDERQATGVEHEKHNHGVRCRIFLRVQLLQSLHGFQSERCGGIVEPEHIGRDIHEDVAHYGVAFRDFGEQAFEDGAQQACQNIHNAAAFANLHHAHPEGEHARQSEGNLEGCA